MTEPGLRTRRTRTDALSRMTEEVENPSGWNGEASYSTTYVYNALDNLTLVTQGGQSWGFLYDAVLTLKRVDQSRPDRQTVQGGVGTGRIRRR